MKRIYSEKDLKSYTYMGRILSDLDLDKKDYLWLISNIEAYPQNKKYQKLINGKSYLLLTTSELISMLKEEDFQWIWAVFSAIPSSYTKEDILKYNLPCLECIDDVTKIQHPFAELEIYAVDSSYMLMVSDSDELIDKFKKCYPKYIEE